MTNDTSSRTSHRRYLIRQLADQEYRDEFVDASITHGIAAQLRSTRADREWTQKELGERADMRQSVIAQLENPDDGRLSVTTLKRLAAAYHVGLIIRFAPFSELVDWAVDLSTSDLAIPSFADDVGGHSRTAPCD